MRIDPGTFLRHAVELGLLTPGMAAEVGARVRQGERAGTAVRIEKLVLERGLMDAEGVGRVIQASRPARPAGTRRQPAADPRSKEPATATVFTSSDDRPVSAVPGATPAVSLLGSGPAGAGTGTKYAVVEVLGRGGMGVVLLAVDRDIGREVAIKKMLEPGDPLRSGRFLVEGQVTGQLEHPNIVPVHELGLEVGTNAPFMVMKRLGGRSLADVLDLCRKETEDKAARGEPPERTLNRLLDVFIKVCDALAYAHSRGAIHRDLKPANVMVGDFGEVHVVDWGLAKVLGRSERVADPVVAAVDDALRTQEGYVSGTPMYMSPEQARGEVSEVDERSDVYALGAMLYEILALAPAFEPTRDLSALLTAVEKGRFALPSERSAAPWALPAELEAVVLKAMALEPEDRYARVLDLSADVQNFLAGRALGAAQYSPWRLLVKWARRHRTAVLGGAATLAAVVLGVVATVVGVATARSGEAERIRAERVAGAETVFEEALERKEEAPMAFHPAAAQEFFLSRLPIAVDMGRAIQAHPEPPRSWRAELAAFTGDLQERAESVADWALAEHLAQSAGAWGAVSPEESEMRLAHAREKRRRRVEEDLARLDDILKRIGEAEDPELRQGGLLPGQIDEWARLAGTFESRSQVAARVLETIAADDDRRLRKWNVIEGRDFDEPTLSRGQRLFCARTLAVLGDCRTPGPAGDAPTSVARTLDTAWQMHLDPEEIGAWMRTAARLEAAAPGSFRDPDVRSLLEKTKAEYSGDAGEASPIAIAARETFRFLDVVAGKTLPRFVGVAFLAEVGEWVAASAAPEIEYTASLLDHAGGDLGPRQIEFVFDLLGLRGDLRSVDPEKPERATVPLLVAALESAPDELLTNAALMGPERGEAARQQARAVAAARNLARLGNGESAGLVLSKRDAGGLGSLFSSRTHLSLAFFPVDTASPASTFEEALLRGRLLAARLDFLAARTQLDRAVELAPERAQGYRYRALVHLALGDGEAALADLDRAVERAGEDAELLVTRGAIRSQQGDPGGALPDLARAVSLRPHGAIPHYELGSHLFRVRDLPGAAEEYSRAIELDPLCYDAYQERAQVLWELGHLDRALADADRLVDLEPSAPRAHRIRGKILQELRRHEEAIEAFTVAFELAPHDVLALEDRAESREALGDRAGAIEDLDRAIAARPTATAYRDRGVLHLKSGRPRAAIEDADRALGIDSSDARACSLRGMARTATSEYSRAGEDYSRAIDIDPGLLEPRLNRGILRMRFLQDLPGAREDLDRALTIEDHPRLRLARAELFQKLSEFEAAVPEARRATELSPESWEGWYWLATSLGFTGKTAEGEKAIEEALRLAPGAMRKTIEEGWRKARGR